MSGIYEHAFAGMDGPFPVIYGTDLWSSDQELEQIKIYIPSPLPTTEMGQPFICHVLRCGCHGPILCRSGQDLEQSQFMKNMEIWAIHK